jgi:hypothetical protein
MRSCDPARSAAPGGAGGQRRRCAPGVAAVRTSASIRNTEMNASSVSLRLSSCARSHQIASVPPDGWATGRRARLRPGVNGHIVGQAPYVDHEEARATFHRCHERVQHGVAGQRNDAAGLRRASGVSRERTPYEGEGRTSSAAAPLLGSAVKVRPPPPQSHSRRAGSAPAVCCTRAARERRQDRQWERSRQRCAPE